MKLATMGSNSNVMAKNQVTQPSKLVSGMFHSHIREVIIGNPTPYLKVWKITTSYRLKYEFQSKIASAT